MISYSIFLFSRSFLFLLVSIFYFFPFFSFSSENWCAARFEICRPASADGQDGAAAAAAAAATWVI